MAKYRTALGRVVDMSILAAKNEKTRAVGNMKVNARGDTIDAFGKIIKPATNKVNETYSNSVGNRAAQPVRKPLRKGNDPVPAQVKPIAPAAVSKPVAPEKPQIRGGGGVNQRIDEPAEQLTTTELEFEDDLEYELEVEQIKAQEKDNGK